MQGSSSAGNDLRHALRYAQRAIFHQAGEGQADIPRCDRAQRLRQPRMSDGKGATGDRWRVAGEVSGKARINVAENRRCDTSNRIAEKPMAKTKNDGRDGPGYVFSASSGVLVFLARTAFAISGSRLRIAEYFSHNL